MGGCPNYGPLLGPLNTRCRIRLRTRKREQEDAATLHNAVCAPELLPLAEQKTEIGVEQGRLAQTTTTASTSTASSGSTTFATGASTRSSMIVTSESSQKASGHVGGTGMTPYSQSSLADLSHAAESMETYSVSPAHFEPTQGGSNMNRIQSPRRVQAMIS